LNQTEVEALSKLAREEYIRIKYHGSFQGEKEGSHFLGEEWIFKKDFKKREVVMSSIKNGDTRGETMNFYKELFKHRTSENGNTGSE
jgi:hypothetical protein